MAPERDRERLSLAFKAMKRLGIRAEDTKPALKQLYKLFNGNWAAIEEDNYRVLADTIFEYQEDKEAEEMNLDEVLSSKDRGKGIARTEPDSSPKSANREGNDLNSSDHENEIVSWERPRPRINTSTELANSSHNCTDSSPKSANGEGNELDSSDHGNEMVSRKRRLINHSSELANSSHNCTDTKKALHRVRDITKGTEKVKISLVDENGYDNLPKFVYCPENIPYESANVHVALARISDEDCCVDCEGDCLSSPLPCACAGSTGGEFAYSTEGLLTQSFLHMCTYLKQSPNLDPNHLVKCENCPLERAKDSRMECQGHVLKKFIKECWRKCGCDMMCGNRVVQRGITRKLQVFSTKERKGWGLRALEELPQGAFVCEYVGEILTNIELYERNSRRGADNGKHTYPVLLDADWSTEKNLKDEEALCLDATKYGNVARFINHRCIDANLIEVPVQVETPDRHYYHLAFFTNRKVDALEELTWDYGIDFADKDHPIKAFRCCCGSPFCRDTREHRKHFFS